MVINKQQIQSYHGNGYLVVENVFDAAMIGRNRHVIAGLVAKAVGVTAHNDVYDLEATHTPENPRVRRIKTPHKVDPLFWDVVRLPFLLESE
jgi:phytanoyl-CoA hydroxylase